MPKSLKACAAPCCISPKYFYDERGSRLFETITRLPEYYPTRTEHAILRASGADIARAIGQGCTLIEPGAGSCAKGCRAVRADCTALLCGGRYFGGLPGRGRAAAGGALSGPGRPRALGATSHGDRSAG